jgi:hypothetical protein
MAHYAFLDDNNVVTEVIVGKDETEIIDGLTPEQWYGNYRGQTCIRTSYNANIRGKYAAIGDSYDPVKDIFVSPPAPISYKRSWFGATNENISLLIDSPARSANQFFNAIAHQAFPNIDQYWGYKWPHNPESFKVIDKFTAVATVVRNPLDSIASSILAFNATNDETILWQINNTLDVLTAINENKNNLIVFTFEDVTTDPNAAMLKLANKLNVPAEPCNVDEVMAILSDENIHSTYAMPIDNATELAKAKDLLSQDKYTDGIAKCLEQYNQIIQ